MKRDGGGNRTNTWRTLEGSFSPNWTGLPAVLHVLPIRLPTRPLVPGSLTERRALDERVDWPSRSGQPARQALGLAVGRLWRRAYRDPLVPKK